MEADKYLVTQAAYNSVAKGYAGNAYAKQWMKGYLADFCVWVGQPGKVLDLGCGPGHDAALFVARGFQVTGFDFSAKMIIEAQKRVLGARFVQGDFREMDFPNDEFDAVWSVGSLHHLPKSDLPEILQKVYWCLKSGGYMFIAVKGGEGEMIATGEQIGVGTKVRKFWSYWQPKEFVKVIGQAGFRVVKQAHTESMRKKELPQDKRNEWWVNVWCRK